MTDLDRIRKTKLKDLGKLQYKKYDYELSWKGLLSWLIPLAICFGVGMVYAKVCRADRRENVESP